MTLEQEAAFEAALLAIFNLGAQAHGHPDVANKAITLLISSTGKLVGDTCAFNGQSHSDMIKAAEAAALAIKADTVTAYDSAMGFIRRERTVH